MAGRIQVSGPPIPAESTTITSLSHVLRHQSKSAIGPAPSKPSCHRKQRDKSNKGEDFSRQPSWLATYALQHSLKPDTHESANVSCKAEDVGNASSRPCCTACNPMLCSLVLNGPASRGSGMAGMVQTALSCLRGLKKNILYLYQRISPDSNSCFRKPLIQLMC